MTNLVSINILITQIEVLITYTDRKSTRLNSSHLVISYAVFCLKKKKQQYTEPVRDLRRADVGSDFVPTPATPSFLLRYVILWYHYLTPARLLYRVVVAHWS